MSKFPDNSLTFQLKQNSLTFPDFPWHSRKWEPCFTHKNIFHLHVRISAHQWILRGWFKNTIPEKPWYILKRVMCYFQKETGWRLIKGDGRSNETTFNEMALLVSALYPLYSTGPVVAVTSVLKYQSVQDDKKSNRYTFYQVNRIKSNHLSMCNSSPTHQCVS